MAHPNLRSESGQGLTEYLILVMLIAIVSIGAAKSMGGVIRRKFSEIQREINHQVSPREESGEDAMGGKPWERGD